MRDNLTPNPFPCGKGNNRAGGTALLIDLVRYDLVTMGTKELVPLRLHDRRCDIVIGRAKSSRTLIFGTARR